MFLFVVFACTSPKEIVEFDTGSATEDSGIDDSNSHVDSAYDSPDTEEPNPSDTAEPESQEPNEWIEWGDIPEELENHEHLLGQF